MSRMRIVLLMLVVSIATSAVATGSASAFKWEQCRLARVMGGGQWENRQCTKGPGSKEFETRGLRKGEEEAAEPIEGTGGEAKLESEIGSTKITIACKKTTFTGNLELEGKSNATIKYTECKLVETSTGKEVTNCTVEPITAVVVDELIENAGALEDKFLQKEGKPFAEITITGASCGFKITKQAVTGTQTCELPHGEEFLEVHEIVCKASGSALKFGSKAATYIGNVRVWKLDRRDWRGQKQ
jgi:hypothetical protein